MKKPEKCEIKFMEEELLRMLKQNENLQFILEHAGELNMPNWYLAAGGLAQTVWNIKHGFNPENGIKDYDLVYCDTNDTSYEGEDVYIRKGKELFKNISVPVEIINEARVHIWYKKELGRDDDQEEYKSTEEAMRAWSITPTAVGISKNPDGKIQICAPFGLNDLLNLVVRVGDNPKILRKVYEDKVNRWVKIWPKLKVIPWDENKI